MTDKEKLDAVRAEIHRLVDVRGYDREMANDLFAFMDSLPNEPVSEDLGEYLYELSKQFPEVSFAKLSRIGVRVAKWQKEHLLKLSDGNDLSEPVSEDLEEASRNYADDDVYDDDIYFAIKAAFKAGAKWQKEQMMSKAIDFIIVDNNATSTEISTFPYVSLGTEGDTVKLIILKQD